jgi:methylenetetrahydrofolate reductase (NADPH)
MKENMKPLFTDMTWGAGGSTADISLDLSLYAQKTGHVSNLHLTCTNLSGDEDPKEAIYKALKSAYEGGIRNIVALRGDPAAGQEEWKASEEGFTCALDLVEFIKLKFGDDFGISVAGYPEGHPNAISEVTDPSSLTVEERTRASCFDGITYCCLEKDYQTELEYLKRKVDAGAGTPYHPVPEPLLACRSSFSP